MIMLNSDKRNYLNLRRVHWLHKMLILIKIRLLLLDWTMLLLMAILDVWSMELDLLWLLWTSLNLREESLQTFWMLEEVLMFNKLKLLLKFCLLILRLRPFWSTFLVVLWNVIQLQLESSKLPNWSISNSLLFVD